MSSADRRGVLKSGGRASFQKPKCDAIFAPILTWEAGSFIIFITIFLEEKK